MGYPTEDGSYAEDRAARHSPIQDAILAQNINIDELEKLAQALRERLEPVLGPDMSDKPMSEDGHPVPPKSSLCERIEANNTRLSSLCRRLQYILQRVEV